MRGNGKRGGKTKAGVDSATLRTDNPCLVQELGAPGADAPNASARFMELKCRAMKRGDGTCVRFLIKNIFNTGVTGVTEPDAGDLIRDSLDAITQARDVEVDE